MGIAIKPGVSIRGIRAELALALNIVADIAVLYGYDTIELTSCTEGRHSPGSLHYLGLAADIGIRHIQEPRKMRDKFAATLGKEFDVVLEATHIHIEYQPKAPR